MPKPDAQAPFGYVLQLDTAAPREADFNHIYGAKHVPEILRAPGVCACTSYVLGRTNRDGMPHYPDVYERESPGVSAIPAWFDASEKGDWAP